MPRRSTSHLLSAGKPPYAQRLGTTIFLHSLTQGIASGVDPADLILATFTPDATVVGTTRRLLLRLWNA